MVNILKKINKKCMPYFVIDSYGLVKLPRINPEDLSFYAVSEKLAELTTKFNILCMEVHDITAQIKLNENSIVSFMRNDGEGSMAALPSAPLRARYSEGCLVVRNSEPKETGDSVGGLAVLPSAPLETGDAVGSMDVPSSAHPEPGDMESNPVVDLLPTVPTGSRDADVGPTVPPTSPPGTSGTGEENGPVVQPFIKP